MREIEPEGTSYIYFSKTDDLPAERVMGMMVSPIGPFMRRQLQLRASTDFRLVLVRSPFRADDAWVYYLHWDDGTDLDAIDIAVKEGRYTDNDFRHAAKTEYQKTRCDGCHRAWDSLVMPTGDPYLGAPGLDDIKLREHVVIQRCPNCGTSFRQLVVKIF
jgi:hypothetical protein